MGKYPRRKQRHLPHKLRQIRESLGLSQSEIINRMGLADELERTIVSNFESGHREPSLYVLLQYAHVSGLCLEVIVDDELEMPKRLPRVPIHRGVMVKRKRPRGT